MEEVKGSKEWLERLQIKLRVSTSVSSFIKNYRRLIKLPCLRKTSFEENYFKTFCFFTFTLWQLRPELCLGNFLWLFSEYLSIPRTRTFVRLMLKISEWLKIIDLDYIILFILFYKYFTIYSQYSLYLAFLILKSRTSRRNTRNEISAYFIKNELLSLKFYKIHQVWFAWKITNRSFSPIWQHESRLSLVNSWLCLFLSLV